jgi:hypothetical protein
VSQSVTMGFTALDLVAIYKDRHSQDMPLADAEQLLDRMRVPLTSAMEAGGYEVLIDYLWDYEEAREEAEAEAAEQEEEAE